MSADNNYVDQPGRSLYIVHHFCISITALINWSCAQNAPTIKGAIIAHVCWFDRECLFNLKVKPIYATMSKQAVCIIDTAAGAPKVGN
jgi:hypothetical protein